MKYYALEPEVAGNVFGPKSVIINPLSTPPEIAHLDYQFDGWLGDDLIESTGVYITTERLKEALLRLNPTGCQFAPANVSTSDEFKQLHPGRQLPEFSWLQVKGVAGRDDFGMSDEVTLVVPERMLDCLQDFNLNHRNLSDYSPKTVVE